MSLCSNQNNPGAKKGEFLNACRRSDKGMLPKPLKERLDEGRGVRKRLSEIEMSICFSSKTKKAEGIAAFLRALPAKQVRIKNSGSARESAGNKIKEGVHVAAAPAH